MQKTIALLPHRKFLIVEKNFLYRPMQAALACIFVLSGWTVFQNKHKKRKIFHFSQKMGILG